MTKSEKRQTSWILICIASVSLALASLALYLSISGRAPVGPGGWVAGSPAEKFETLAFHQRGLDQAMWEVGYRYHELAWAGDQQDWNYARYQVEKIKLTLEQAIERRPARTENTRLFFQEGLEPILLSLDYNPRDNFAPVPPASTVTPASKPP